MQVNDVTAGGHSAEEVICYYSWRTLCCRWIMLLLLVDTLLQMYDVITAIGHSTCKFVMLLQLVDTLLKMYDVIIAGGHSAADV